MPLGSLLTGGCSAMPNPTTLQVDAAQSLENARSDVRTEQAAEGGPGCPGIMIDDSEPEAAEYTAAAAAVYSASCRVHRPLSLLRLPLARVMATTLPAARASIRPSHCAPSASKLSRSRQPTAELRPKRRVRFPHLSWHQIGNLQSMLLLLVPPVVLKRTPGLPLITARGERCPQYSDRRGAPPGTSSALSQPPARQHAREAP